MYSKPEPRKEPLYEIVRFYRKSNRQRIQRRDMTLADARMWCSRPDTHKEGAWFDGFRKQ